MFQRVNEVTLDDNLSTYNTLKFVDRWLSFRLEVLGNFIVLFASGLAILSSSQAGSTGLSLNNALGITGLLNWAVRNAAEAESYMNSVERVYHTIEQTPQERLRVVGDYDSSTFVYNSKTILDDDDDDTTTLSDRDSNSYVSDDNHDDIIRSIKVGNMEQNDGDKDDAVVEADASVNAHFNADMSNSLQLDASSLSSCIEGSLISSSFDKLSNPHSDDSSGINTVSATSPSPSFQSSIVHLHPQNDSDLISSGWPYSGGIVIDEVKLRYRKDFSLVLKGISVSISPGERIGIVGE